MKILIVFLFISINTINCQNFPPLSKHAIGLRFNRYGRSEFDYSDQDPIRNCGKRKRTVEINRKCFRQCQSDADCRGSKRKCLCDGECGLSCVRITTVCQKIGEFANGYVNYYPDNYFGAQLVYDCNPGYSLNGDKIRICEGDGWWSGTSPICIKETFCDPPKPAPNAIPNIQIFNESKFKSGTEVEYQCDIGYTLNSDQELSKIVCMDNGKWSDVKFKCNRINCGRPDEIENGIIKGNDFFYSSVIEYKCVNGYRIRNGDYLRECGLDSKWSGRKPICEPVDCGEPPYVKNAILNYNSTRYNNKAKYNCVNSKFYIEKNDYVICQSNGRWSEPAVVCVEKTCRLDPVEYSLKKYNLFTSNPTINMPMSDNFNYTIDTSVKFICESGYMLNKNYNEIICVFNPRDETINWNSEAPKCRKENFCPFIAPPDNGLITSDKKQSPQGYPVNSTIEFKCSLGYVLKGTNNLTCVEILNKDLVYEAKWSQVENDNFCEPISNLIQNQCKIEKNELIQWDKSVGESISSGDIATYSCKNNKVKHSAKCINGSLIMEENCEAKSNKLSCLAPPKLLNGYNKYSSTQHGSKVLYQCLNGYELSKGNAELRCENGEWIGSIPSCSKMSCAFPGNLENGKIFYVGTMAEYAYHPYMNTLGQNKQIRYECEKGFKLVGPNGSTCINGNWKPSIKLVKCEKDEFVGTIYANETIKSELDENIISIGLKNDRKAKSLFMSNDESVGIKRRKSKKYLKLRRMNKKRKNGTLIHDQTATKRKFKNLNNSFNQTFF